MGLRIRELRNAKGWTQEQLAEAAHMSRSQLAMIEAETRPANTLRLSAIAKALGVAPEQLFDSKEDQDAVDSLKVAVIMQGLSAEDRSAIVRIAESLAAKAGST